MSVYACVLQTYLNTPTCVAWKNDFMVAGDADGALFFHDNKLNQTRFVPSPLPSFLPGSSLPYSLLPSLPPMHRTIETPRAVVKKLRFAPGKGNSKLFVLYNSRLDIRDTQQVSGCDLTCTLFSAPCMLLGYSDQPDEVGSQGCRGSDSGGCGLGNLRPARVGD